MKVKDLIEDLQKHYSPTEDVAYLIITVDEVADNYDLSDEDARRAVILLDNADSESFGYNRLKDIVEDIKSNKM